jgi:preprotein translocase subunit SecB
MANHPIQFIDIEVRELSIKRTRPPLPMDPAPQIIVQSGKGQFDAADKVIRVGIRAIAPAPDQSLSFSLCVELVGVFAVDTANFDISNLDPWCEQNAPYILNPYLREQVYSLTLRAGSAILLPMLQVPTTRQTVQPPC